MDRPDTRFLIVRLILLSAGSPAGKQEISPIKEEKDHEKLCKRCNAIASSAFLKAIAPLDRASNCRFAFKICDKHRWL